MLLDGWQRISEDLGEGITKLQISTNAQLTSTCLWETSKAGLRGRCVTLSACVKMLALYQINNLLCTSRSRKNQKTNPKAVIGRNNKDQPGPP